MRRSFRTHRLCAISGGSPRAGMRCPVGALQTPHLPRAPTAPSALATTHRVNDDCFSSTATIKPPHRGTCPPNHEAAAGSGRSEHRNVDILIPVARQRESQTGPNVPCERRTDPAEPPPPTSPRRQPQNSATATPRGAPPRDRRTLPVPWHLGPPHRAFLAIPTSDLFSNSPSPVPCRLDTGG
jgi:hypothetical protein